MTYTAQEAMTVALFNAGVRENNDKLPVVTARLVVQNLRSMGWLLDGYLHEEAAGLNPMSTDLPPEERGSDD